MVLPVVTPALIRLVKNYLKKKKGKKNPVGRRPGKVKSKKSKTTGYQY